MEVYGCDQLGAIADVSFLQEVGDGNLGSSLAEFFFVPAVNEESLMPRTTILACSSGLYTILRIMSASGGRLPYLTKSNITSCLHYKCAHPPLCLKLHFCQRDLTQLGKLMPRNREKNDVWQDYSIRERDIYYSGPLLSAHVASPNPRTKVYIEFKCA
ncbi:hypothetical protein KSP40_PGU014877 [Platanthera guangdongensis]|uniref:Uncharacterized protein n=1 Tax=Platanthera guangdongensis TaxID=2320717 RepID=A0ABR2MM69_9ASPA